MKIVEKIQLKIVIFTAVKNRCILHGRVFVMISKFQVKKCDVFLCFVGTVRTAFSGGSNETPQYMFKRRTKNIIHIPVNPSFTI